MHTLKLSLLPKPLQLRFSESTFNGDSNRETRNEWLYIKVSRTAKINELIVSFMSVWEKNRNNCLVLSPVLSMTLTRPSPRSPTVYAFPVSSLHPVLFLYIDCRLQPSGGTIPSPPLTPLPHLYVHTWVYILVFHQMSISRMKQSSKTAKWWTCKINETNYHLGVGHVVAQIHKKEARL